MGATYRNLWGATWGGNLGGATYGVQPMAGNVRRRRNYSPIPKRTRKNPTVGKKGTRPGRVGTPRDRRIEIIFLAERYFRMDSPSFGWFILFSRLPADNTAESSPLLGRIAQSDVMRTSGTVDLTGVVENPKPRRDGTGHNVWPNQRMEMFHQKMFRAFGFLTKAQLLGKEELDIHVLEAEAGCGELARMFMHIAQAAHSEAKSHDANEAMSVALPVHLTTVLRKYPEPRSQKFHWN